MLLAGVCLVAIAPFFWWGNPSGHDFEFHIDSWMEVLNQWKHGIVYPRWAALAHWGYGEARFLFYPPVSWTLGAVLGAVLPWKIVPGAYCWIALLLAGASMYRLAREWLAAPAAMFAAVFYALNPYNLLIVYWRSAYAEILAAALLPLLLVCLLRIFLPKFEPDPRPTLCLSLLLAAAWMTNLPAAVMIHYSTAGLVLLYVVREAARGKSRSSRLWRPLIQTALATLLAAGLASFFLLPAIYEQKWIDISQVLSPGVRPQDNFLFTTLTDPDHNRFNLLLSTIALAEIAALALAIWGSRRGRSNPLGTTDNVPWMLLSAWGITSVFLMLSASRLLWRYLPQLRFVQLPFRWLLPMNAALAMLLAMATQRWNWKWTWTGRGLASAVLLAVLILAGHRIQPPWWETAPDIQEISDAVHDGTGYEGTDEYVPAGADPYELNKNLPPISDNTGAPLPSEMLARGPTEKHFTVHAAKAQNLTVRLLSYPAWEVVVNGQPTATEKTDITGLIVVPIAAGENDVQIHFRRTIDRVVGNAVSLISVAVFFAAWTNTKMRRMQSRVLVATSNPGKLRDFAGAAAPLGITIANIPRFSSLPQVVEDGATFEENARKKAESYSLAVPGQLVLADDSGLEIDALSGAPGVHSARYAARDPHASEPQAAEHNSDDEANNARVLRELRGIPEDQRTARFVCVLAVARDGHTLHTCRGTAEGIILNAPRGENGFGYDPLFFFPAIQKTFAELSPEEKAHHSHRGAAFRAFLEWYHSAKQ